MEKSKPRFALGQQVQVGGVDFGGSIGRDSDWHGMEGAVVELDSCGVMIETARGEREWFPFCEVG